VAVIGGFGSDLLITRKIDGNLGNVAAGVVFQSRINENGGNYLLQEFNSLQENVAKQCPSMEGFIQSSKCFKSGHPVFPN